MMKIICLAFIVAGLVLKKLRDGVELVTMTWRNKDGTEILISDMDNVHLLNAYKFSIRMTCTKVNDMDSGTAAFEDGHLDVEEHRFFVERNRRDLLDVLDQMKALKKECAKRGLTL